MARKRVGEIIPCFHKYNGPKERKNTKESQSSDRPPLKCYFCDGPHKARDCPRKAKLSAIVEEREGQQQREETRMGSLQILNAIKAKVEVPKTEKRGRLYVEAKVSNQVVKALVDTGASNNFL